jgi:hypothetical protein
MELLKCCQYRVPGDPYLRRERPRRGKPRPSQKLPTKDARAQLFVQLVV